MTVRFNSTMIVPNDIQQALTVDIEGPLAPYAFTWDLNSEDSVVGNEQDFITIAVTVKDSLLGENKEELKVTFTQLTSFTTSGGGTLVIDNGPFRAFLPAVEIIEGIESL